MHPTRLYLIKFVGRTKGKPQLSYQKEIAFDQSQGGPNQRRVRPPECPAR
jgi:hypothetical protein